MTYTLREIRDFLSDIAVFDTAIPKDEDYVMFDIPMPTDGLVCRVNTKVNINTSKADLGTAEVFLYNTRKNETAHVQRFMIEEDNWQTPFESHIRAEVGNWREYVL